MPTFSGVDQTRTSRYGEIAFTAIPGFMQKCKDDGWVRVAVSEMRILASFNEKGEWLHPDLKESA